MKTKTKFRFFLLCLFLFLPLFTYAAGPFDYVPMENIPGFEGQATDFYQYISSVYKFGIWAIGIAALLMIAIGGYMYITSAGNNSSMEKAKGVITDAVVGLVLALGAYLLLYVINPDLVKITKLEPVAFTPVSAPVTAPTTTPISTATCNDGKCSQVDSAISSNASGINSALLKSLIVGGEGCNPAISPKGACGYSQVMPLIRNAYCNGASCSQLQADTQLAVNCGAAYVKAEIESYCHGDAKCTGACYNLGMTICRRNPNNCGEANYCQRVQNYYASCTQ